MDDDIDAARHRVTNGMGDRLDEYRLRAAERREQIVRKDMPTAVDSYFVRTDDDEVVRGIYEDCAEAIGVLSSDLRAEIRELQNTVTDLRIEVSALKGEMRGMRGTKTACSCGNGPKILRPDQ